MISLLLDPIFVALLLLLIGLLVWTRSPPRRALLKGKIIAWMGFALLWIGASPWFSSRLSASLEPRPVDLTAALSDTEPSQRALVILAGGKRYDYDFLPSAERLGPTTQARLLGAARIIREHGPFSLVIVSGTGMPFVTAMADYLTLHGVPKDSIVLEPKATDTTTNAVYSAAILQEHPKQRVVLVTSALHIPRSVAEFHKVGIEVVPAPVDYVGGRSFQVIPSANSLSRTARCTHELLGHFEP